METPHADTSTPLIDTHTHCYGEEYAEDQNQMLLRAIDAGVDTMLLAATDASSASQQDDLQRRYPGHIRQMMGLHPCEVGRDHEERLEAVRTLLFANTDNYVAVGEIGLDYHWDATHRLRQLDALKKQLLWARQLDKPASIHVRDAYDDFFQLLHETNHGLRERPGVVHCFSGTVAQAERLVSMGFLLGIGGIVTYKRSLMADVVAAIPLEHLLLETDAPYLAPLPHRGRRNEEVFLLDTAAKVADIKGIDPRQVAATTTATARRLFQL